MREITFSEISKTVEKLFSSSNVILPKDIKDCLEKCRENEKKEIAKAALDTILYNAQIAEEKSIPICQDTGMAVVFAEIGQEVHITGGLFSDAVNDGVKNAYIGKLRCSVVFDPLKRKNTNDNTPAIIHTKLVSGDKIKITAVPKGFGSENMSKIKMFNPSAAEEEIIDFICNSVFEADSMPCPPIIVGVGLGGDFEKAAILSKEALTVPLNEENPDEYYNALEKKILERINEKGCGVQGFGGNNTALSVKIKTYPTHIAGLPVAINIGCHVTRHETAII